MSSCITTNPPSTVKVVQVGSPLAVKVIQSGPAGPPGLPGDGISVIGEIPGGVVNGSNASFTTQFAFVPESVEVFINGLRQHRPGHFNTSGTTTIILSDSPALGELIQVNYLRA